MILLISGASHTGKTLLAQQLLEQFHIRTLSQDHLKMGLIRSGQTELTPLDDEQLKEYLWPITKEIIKTAIENHQDLIVEGCYIPFNWKESFEEDYLQHIQYVCLVMSETYLLNHRDEIIRHGDIVECRLDKELNIKALVEENLYNKMMCERYQLLMIVIDDQYDVFEQAKRLFQIDKNVTIES